MDLSKNLNLENLSIEFEGEWYIEEWKPIKDYEELYEISSFGRIKSLAKEWVSGKGLIKKKEESILVQADKRDKYKGTNLFRSSIKSTFIVHRLVAAHFIPNPDDLPEVNHKNGVKWFNFYKNLEWSTGSDNILHAFRTGLRKPTQGEGHGMRRLSNEDVIKIRDLYSRGIYQYKIGEMFGVRQQQISRIIRGQRWGHI